MALSDLKIRKAQPKPKPYKLADAGGLFVLVKPNGSKLWQQKYRRLGALLHKWGEGFPV
ncbi:Arm DNA-binding domain-containing protein [Ruegeria sp. EL01]|uniref:Arm DNA-binding domain-containing protein n=1 Tax=Ruegeria sp. EL01 TaxID=2107578 RepID=UPI000EA82141|nr:Arm DNA-binding domain-containing protein [Ruegeria sp. EL01]